MVGLIYIPDHIPVWSIDPGSDSLGWGGGGGDGGGINAHLGTDLSLGL